MNIKFRPLMDRLLVLPDPPVSMTKSGLYIPDGGKEKPTQGTVIRVGPGRLNVNPADPCRYTSLAVKEGEKVLYGQYAGSTVKIDSVEMVLLKEEDVLGVIEE